MSLNLLFFFTVFTRICKDTCLAAGASVAAVAGVPEGCPLAPPASRRHPRLLPREGPLREGRGDQRQHPSDAAPGSRVSGSRIPAPQSSAGYRHPAAPAGRMKPEPGTDSGEDRKIVHVGRWLGRPSSSQEPRLRRPLRLVMDGVYPFFGADLLLRFRMSLTQVKAATVVGKPRVGIARQTACLISFCDAPA